MAKKSKSAETPLMKQYNSIKAKHPDALLLFRVGDFYETFGQDAIDASDVLGIVLTKRHNGSAGQVELAGFPHHSLNTYLPKLVRSGRRVAICDQLEDPKLTKKIVKRGVTELVTPGVTYNDQVLEQKKNNFLASIHIEGTKAGAGFIDISTGEFFVAEGSLDYVKKIIHGFQPSELVFDKKNTRQIREVFEDSFYTFALDDWVFGLDFGKELLSKHFETNSLKGFGLDNKPLSIVAAGAVMHYLSETQHHRLSHISSISRIESENYVWLDSFTIRNLELLNTINHSGKSLVDIIDNTQTPMGGRLLKRWVAFPLKDHKDINHRLELTSSFISQTELNESIKDHLFEIKDLERMASKVATARISPREMVHLSKALDSILEIVQLLNQSNLKPLMSLAKNLDALPKVKTQISSKMDEEPAAAIGKGNVIANGCHKELDELRSIKDQGKAFLDSIQQRETERTGIPSIKIGYNNVFGYYIEVRNTHKSKVPEDWIRKQTLVNAERYITEELKEYESKILGAEEKILQLEKQLFDELIIFVADYIVPLQQNAKLLAELDIMGSFARIAAKYNYTRPKVSDQKTLQIKEGRHPVIERELPPGEEYISNDVLLNESQQILMITGPNMSGKSAVLRQTALIVIMAQIGCYVPAKHAEIGVVDRIFTRVGASDNISMGESTFMVEMNETASILNNISDRSLILLDEIGRGTSTYDGISIAWAIAEYIHEHPKVKAKTLFATHYHELNDMASSFSRIKNFHVSIREIDNKVIFLRKLLPGGTEHSFGIHVAKMAGMPAKLIQRANLMLKELEDSHVSASPSEKTKDEDGFQLSFIQLDDPVLEQIKDELIKLDVDNLTPVEALLKLNEIKRLVGG